MTDPTNKQIAAWLRAGADLFDPALPLEPPPTSDRSRLHALVDSAHIGSAFAIHEDVPSFNSVFDEALGNGAAGHDLPSAFKVADNVGKWGLFPLSNEHIPRRPNDFIKVDGNSTVTVQNVVAEGFTDIAGPHVDWLQMRLGSPDVGVYDSVFNCVGSNKVHGNGMQNSETTNSSLFLSGVALIGGIHPLIAPPGSRLGLRNVYFFRIDAVRNWDGSVGKGLPILDTRRSHGYTIGTWENVFEVWPDGTMTVLERPTP